MEYSNKQIKCVLRIQEFVEMSNTLSKIYGEFDDKELSITNLADKNRIYKVYCSSIYNLLDAIKKSKDLFGNCKKYTDFQNFINREYVAYGNKYYEKSNYKSNFYKIMKAIRDQVNHYTRDDEDENILFEINIDFTIIEELRLMINDIFNEIYNKIDKKRIEQLILSKPKIQYSFDKINDKIDLMEQKCNESTNEVDKIFSRENAESIQILRNYFNPNNMLNLLNKDENIVKKYDLMDDRMNELFEQQCQYLDSNGTEQQKMIVNLVREFVSKDITTKNDYDKKLKDLANEIIDLSGNQDKN